MCAAPSEDPPGACTHRLSAPALFALHNQRRNQHFFRPELAPPANLCYNGSVAVGVMDEPVLREYESQREEAWLAFAQEARRSDVYRTARDYLGRRRAALAAMLETVLRAKPGDERHRLEADPEYFVARAEDLMAALRPPAPAGELARKMAAFLHGIQRQSKKDGDNESYPLTRAAVRLTTAVDAAADAHDAYREFRCRVLPQRTRTSAVASAPAQS